MDTRTCKNGHPYEGNRRQKRRGTTCILCARTQDRTAKMLKRRNQAPTSARSKGKTDGYEDVYGPIPARVPNSEWYDEVIVIRALTHQKTGRIPYPKEWAAIFQREHAWAEVSNQSLADAIGVQIDWITRMRSRHGG